MKRIAFYTLGCKVNQADTASMEAIFRSHGYTVVGFNCEADIYVINTCVVTNTGQRKSRQMINRAVRRNPTAFVVVTGCYPQTAAEEVKTIPGVDLIIGNQDRADIVRLVEEAAAFQSVDTIDSVRKLSANTEFEELSAGDVSDKTRAFLKIQEGCNQFCTYCIIPFARGPLRSRSLTSIMEEVKKLVVSGYKEIVLIGIHLGCYGKEHDGKLTLFDAVEAALSVEGLQRLRLGSLESVEVEARLLNLMEKDKRLCRQLHLPLQAGCDTTLARIPDVLPNFWTISVNVFLILPLLLILLPDSRVRRKRSLHLHLFLQKTAGSVKCIFFLIPNGRELRPKKCPIKFLKLLSKDVVHNLLSLIISSSRNF
jgi:threonylcarbamoyladenosine tRNA methylthiotransferase MtaB